VEQLVRVVGSAYFPRDIARAKAPLQQGGLQRPKDSLVTSFVDALLYGFFERPELKHREETLTALNATMELFPGLTMPRLRRAGPRLCRDIADDELAWFFLLLRYVPQVWDMLERDNRTRLEEYVWRANPALAIWAIATALTINDLRAVATAKVQALLVVDVGPLLTWTRDPIVVNRAVDLFCLVRNWIAANEAYETCIRPVLNDLPDASLQRILNAQNVESADLLGSQGFGEFIRYVRGSGKVPADLEHAMERWPHLRH
jgi:hypothetical protein